MCMLLTPYQYALFTYYLCGIHKQDYHHNEKQKKTKNDTKLNCVTKIVKTYVSHVPMPPPTSTQWVNNITQLSSMSTRQNKYNVSLHTHITIMYSTCFFYCLKSGRPCLVACNKMPPFATIAILLTLVSKFIYGNIYVE